MIQTEILNTRIVETLAFFSFNDMRDVRVSVVTGMSSPHAHRLGVSHVSSMPSDWKTPSGR
ncbi:hypothetical protein ENHYD8BJ_50409 [Enhydrobacter sp. 8BJ]|nr:hypothetical protein ENHYD8BJ_50409 [Enhydrobacter sp. 8BJ]VXB83434.1 hypothetical protein ENHYDAX1_60256 [Enhydrobacter sp. AX1]